MYNVTVNTQSNRNSFNRHFGGYNNTYNVSENEFTDMKNMSVDRFPFISSRKQRTIVSTWNDYDYVQAHQANRLFALCEHEGKYHCLYDGLIYGTLPIQEKKRNIVSIGHKVVIFPDKVMFEEDVDNVANTKRVEMEHKVVISRINFQPCDTDGNLVKSTAAIADPFIGHEYVDFKRQVVMRYTASGYKDTPLYTSIAVQAQGTIPEYCPAAGDRITITGAGGTDYSKKWVVVRADTEWWSVDGDTTVNMQIIAQGGIPAAYSYSGAMSLGLDIPEMDYVCSYNNRLWGCSNINHEIYVSKLGDPTNWQSFCGVSTDSYTATIGSPGDFTGCIGYNGSVLFFKEDRIHRLTGNYPSEFVVTEIHCRGLQKGSEQSLAIIDERLFYKAVDGVMMYTGGLPTSISSAIEGERYRNAIAGGVDNKYYISMVNSREERWLYCYNITTGLWTKEDIKDISWMIPLYNDLILKADGVIYSIKGLKSLTYGGPSGVPDEGVFDWFVESVDLLQGYIDRKRVKSIKIRAEISKGSRVNVSIKQNGTWDLVKVLDKPGNNTYLIPIVPNYCDSFKFKIHGFGDVVIRGINVEFEEGSNV